MAEKALTAMIPEAYEQNVSTRSVRRPPSGRRAGPASPRAKCRGKEIDARVKDFLNRTLEGDWPYVWVDATDVKVRRNHRIVLVAVINAAGVNAIAAARCSPSTSGLPRF